MRNGKKKVENGIQVNLMHYLFPTRPIVCVFPIFVLTLGNKEQSNCFFLSNLI